MLTVTFVTWVDTVACLSRIMHWLVENSSVIGKVTDLIVEDDLSEIARCSAIHLYNLSGFKQSVFMFIS